MPVTLTAGEQTIAAIVKYLVFYGLRVWKLGLSQGLPQVKLLFSLKTYSSRQQTSKLLSFITIQ